MVRSTRHDEGWARLSVWWGHAREGWGGGRCHLALMLTRAHPPPSPPSLLPPLLTLSFLPRRAVLCLVVLCRAVGPQYRSVIMYHDEEQKKVAEEVRGWGGSRRRCGCGCLHWRSGGVCS